MGQGTYSDNKQNWVTFSSGKKKIKLRKFLDDISRAVTKFNGFTYKENRTEFIKHYNEFGLKGLIESYKDALLKEKEKKQKEAEETLKQLQKSKKQKDGQ